MSKESSQVKKPTSDEALHERIDNLEELISKLAVMTGQGNILREFGIQRWNPSKKDMNKYKG